MTHHTYVLPEFALSTEEGTAAYETMRPHLDEGHAILLDTAACRVLCTHWLSGFYSPLFDDYGASGVRELVTVSGASERNQRAVDLMFEVAAQWERENPR